MLGCHRYFYFCIHQFGSALPCLQQSDCSGWVTHDACAAAVDLDGPLILLRMEFLSRAVWRYPPELSDAEKPAALDAAKCALDVVHGLELPSGGTGVHGDLRAPNVLLRKDDSGAPTQTPCSSRSPPACRAYRMGSFGVCHGCRWKNSSCQGKHLANSLQSRLNVTLLHADVWHVIFFDFDWSGELGKARYPDLPNPSLQWPPGADWNELITQEHDRWQLEHAFAVRIALMHLFVQRCLTQTNNHV